ncbi:hypothetical protein SETIT_6G018800v2 [Setaria italica]|uniref:Histone deacetylase interacting domain-containing protein n=2 Tax=Setaria TaxID=4554 RepID=A0A368RH92_SETIT|nr:hypothetical protein SETIT_6G018800v2 [Setaria italica]TKW08252.1 hypothetical protein SEVIR_6G017100v2 [Setaria viridis]
MGCTGGRKRAREEAPMASRARDPRPRKTTQDSLHFLATMKSKLAGEMDKYNEFITAIGEFKAGRMDIAGVANYVNVLLAGHPDLICAFNEFLPWDYVRSHGPAGGSGI